MSNAQHSFSESVAENGLTLPKSVPSITSEPAWRDEVSARLRQLFTLELGWDSYRAKPIPMETIGFAWKLLNSAMQYSQLQPPSIVPTADGGVQFEWHDKDIDLEIHVAKPYECEFLFEDHRDGTRIARELTTDFSDLNRPLWLLSARA